MIKILKGLNKNKIFLKNAVFILLVIFIPFFIIELIYIQNYRDTVTKDIFKYNENILNIGGNTTNYLIENMKILTALIAMNDKVEIYSYSNNPKAIVSDIEQKIMENIVAYKQMYQYVDSIYIYSKSRNRMIMTGFGDVNVDDTNEKDWLKSLNLSGKSKLNIVHRSLQKGMKRLSFIYSFTDENGKSGAVIVNTDMNDVSKIISNGNNDQMYFFISEEGEMLFDTLKESVKLNVPLFEETAKKIDINTSEKRKINEQDYVISSNKLSDYNGKLVLLTPLNEHTNRLDFVNVLLVQIMISGFIIVIIIAIFLSYKTSKPVKNILYFLKNNAHSTAISETDSFEVKEIVSAIVNIMNSNKELNDQLLNHINLLNNAQIAALQAQMNPHFLYNTLNAINCMIIDDDVDKFEVSNVVHNLSKLLRYIMNTKTKTTTLIEEIEFSKTYVDIMQKKYSDPFVVKWDIDEEFNSVIVPKLLFQPIIENAIYHGLIENDKEGVISIDAKKNNECLILKISDNGVGISDEKLQQLNKSFESKNEQQEKYIGLFNVNSRIKLLWDEKYGISLENNQNGGMSVTIRIPAV